MIWVADDAGHLLFANAAWREATGLDPASFTPEKAIELVYPADRKRTNPGPGETGGLPSAIDYRLRFRDGRHRWVTETVRPWRDAEGRVIGHIGTTTDVHDRRCHDRRIALVALHQSALACFGRYILEHHDTESVNAEALRLLREHLGLDAALHTRADSEDALPRVLARSELPEDTPPIEPRLTPAGLVAIEFPSQAEAFPLDADWMSSAGWGYGLAVPVDPASPGAGCLIGLAVEAPAEPTSMHFARELAGIYAVADARRRAERKLREGAERAHQLQKLEAVGLLAGGVAHDFNNLLTAIRCFAELLRDDLGDETQRARVDDILHASSRASHLVRQLLSFSRQEMVQIEPIDLHALVDNLRGFIRSLLSEHVRIEFQLGGEAAWCRADPKQIEQVLFNLCLNARDVMVVDGDLTVSVSHGPDGSDGRRRVRLSVADTGPGIPPEAQVRLFQPFYTTKARGRGTGLGLATSRSIARGFGGELSFETTPGKGTVFHLDLPEIADPLASLPVEEESKAASRRASILLVEDDDLVRAVTLMLAESLGHRVTAHGSSQEALAWCEQGGLDGVDVLITDVVMPGLNGHELAKRLLARRPDLPVLYMSGYVDDPATLAALGEPGVHFLAKPFSNHDFATRLDSVLARLPQV